jgi:hypothetical protein
VRERDPDFSAQTTSGADTSFNKIFIVHAREERKRLFLASSRVHASINKTMLLLFAAGKVLSVDNFHMHGMKLQLGEKESLTSLKDEGE